MMGIFLRYCRRTCVDPPRRNYDAASIVEYCVYVCFNCVYMC
jgi:hypothetical protein